MTDDAVLFCDVIDSSCHFFIGGIDAVDEDDHARRAGVIGNGLCIFFVVVVVVGEGVFASEVGGEVSGVFLEIVAEDGEVVECEKAVKVDFSEWGIEDEAVEVGTLGVTSRVGREKAAESGRIETTAEVDKVVDVALGGKAPGGVVRGVADLLFPEGCVAVGGENGGGVEKGCDVAEKIVDGCYDGVVEFDGD